MLFEVSFARLRFDTKDIEPGFQIFQIFNSVDATIASFVRRYL
jgi:hypothetical protein